MGQANRDHSTRGHAYKLLHSDCRVDVRKSFFAERVYLVKLFTCRTAPFNSLSVFIFFAQVDLPEFVLHI